MCLRKFHQRQLESDLRARSREQAPIIKTSMKSTFRSVGTMTKYYEKIQLIFRLAKQMAHPLKLPSRLTP